MKVAIAEVVLHDGHECGHLTEQQHSVAGGPELRQDAIEELKLPGSSIQIEP